MQSCEPHRQNNAMEPSSMSGWLSASKMRDLASQLFTLPMTGVSTDTDFTKKFKNGRGKIGEIGRLRDIPACSHTRSRWPCTVAIIVA